MACLYGLTTKKGHLFCIIAIRIIRKNHKQPETKASINENVGLGNIYRTPTCPPQKFVHPTYDDYRFELDWMVR
jgi:hypothetical protein